MANTALVGDNHGMFHQVAPTGPFDEGTIRVSPAAALAPVAEPGGEWVVADHGEVRFRAPLDTYRVSVLWKADVYATAAERDRRQATSLSMSDVADAFNEDLARRGSEVRFDPALADDPALKAAMAIVYPEAVPVGALTSSMG
jgi:hypothetical protein